MRAGDPGAITAAHALHETGGGHQVEVGVVHARPGLHGAEPYRSLRWMRQHDITSSHRRPPRERSLMKTAWPTSASSSNRHATSLLRARRTTPTLTSHPYDLTHVVCSVADGGLGWGAPRVGSVPYAVGSLGGTTLELTPVSLLLIPSMTCIHLSQPDQSTAAQRETDTHRRAGQGARAHPQH